MGNFAHDSFLKLPFNTAASLQLLPTRPRRAQMLVFAADFEVSQIAVSWDLSMRCGCKWWLVNYISR
jgi:hypothetical protein